MSPRPDLRTLASGWTRAWRFALGPVPALRLQAFRWTATLALLVYTLAWSLEAGEWLTAAGYHLSPEVSRGLQLPVPLLGERALPVFLIAYIGSMVAVLLGVWPRLFSGLVLVGLAYVTTADRLAAFSMNRLALVAYLILVLAPWPARGKAERKIPAGPDQAGAARLPILRSAWPLRILQATLLLQYFGAGICKLRGNWLSEPRALWLQCQDIYMTELAAWLVRELPLWGWAGLQYGALAFELLAPLLFCVRRLRPLAFVWGGLMHLAIGLMMYRVGYFSFSVVAYYVLFFDERWLIALREKLGSPSAPQF